MAENDSDEQFVERLQKSLRANKAMLAALQYDIGIQIEQAANGGGEYPAPMDLVQIKKLELQVENDELFLEARALTVREGDEPEVFL